MIVLEIFKEALSSDRRRKDWQDRELDSDAGATMRRAHHLMQRDTMPGRVQLAFPPDMQRVPQSFIESFVGPSMAKLGSPEAFISKYHITGSPHLVQQVQTAALKYAARRTALYAAKHMIKSDSTSPNFLL